MATLGISVLPAPYANPVHSSPQCHSLSGFQITNHHIHSAASPSLSRPKPTVLLERGGPTPCPGVQRLTNNGEAKMPMSHNRSLSGSSSDDLPPTPTAATSTEESNSPAEKKRKAPADSQSPETRDAERPRPVSWPSGPVEPPTRLPPIAVPSILNPAKGSHARLPSSPTPRFAHPSSTNPAKRLSLSPGMQQRQMAATPMSPSSRFASMASNYPGKLNTAHHSPLAQESRSGVYSTPGSPLTMMPSTASLGSGPAPASASVHSTLTFHSRQISAGPTPNPSPQETSASTPQSVYSHFGRSSPSFPGASGPSQVPPMLHPSPYGTPDSVSRFPPAIGGHRYPTEPPSGMPGAQPDQNHALGLIPCVLDLKSGSSSQAEKRKANSDASRRFRNRKRNELQMEQKITAQQEEMRKQAELLHRQTHELRALAQEREYYRSERDFYREQLGRVLPPSQLPARPASPRALSSAMEKPADRGNESVWQQGAAPATSLPAPVPATKAPGTWTTAPSAYSTAPSTNSVVEEQPARSLPQLSSTWARS